MDIQPSKRLSDLPSTTWMGTISKEMKTMEMTQQRLEWQKDWEGRQQEIWEIALWEVEEDNIVTTADRTANNQLYFKL